MLEIIKAIIYGIVEGITEWLPISSTGHMILLNEFVQLDVSDSFYKMFEVVIQLGAILAVVVLFWNQIWPVKRNQGRHGGASVTIDRDIMAALRRKDKTQSALVAAVKANLTK